MTILEEYLSRKRLTNTPLADEMILLVLDCYRNLLDCYRDLTEQQRLDAAIQRLEELAGLIASADEGGERVRRQFQSLQYTVEDVLAL